MAYDIPSVTPWHPGEIPFFVLVRGEDAAEITGYWNGLCEGSTVIRPLEPAAWATLYGMVNDRFGVTWVVDVVGVKPGPEGRRTQNGGGLASPPHVFPPRICWRHTMTDHSITAAAQTGPIPADDLGRTLTVVDPDDAIARHISLIGDKHTILISGAQTDGRYCLIDMLVPAGNGPPPLRHDVEEMFSLLEKEIKFTVRGQTQTVKAPATVNIPANASHAFRNTSGQTVHMLCMCAPAGQEEFFMAVGLSAANRTAPPPQVSPEDQAAKGQLSGALAPKYRTVTLKHA